VHRLIAGQVVGDGRACQLLADGQLERQFGVERRAQPIGQSRPRYRAVASGSEPPLGQQHLQREGLIPFQPRPRPGNVGVVDWPVDAAQRVRIADEPVLAPHRRGQRIVRDV